MHKWVLTILLVVRTHYFFYKVKGVSEVNGTKFCPKRSKLEVNGTTFSSNGPKLTPNCPIWVIYTSTLQNNTTRSSRVVLLL